VGRREKGLTVNNNTLNCRFYHRTSNTINIGIHLIWQNHLARLRLVHKQRVSLILKKKKNIARFRSSSRSHKLLPSLPHNHHHYNSSSSHTTTTIIMTGRRPKLKYKSVLDRLIQKMTQELGKPEQRARNTFGGYLAESATEFDDPVEIQYYAEEQMWLNYFPDEPFPGQLIEVNPRLSTTPESPGADSGMMANATPSVEQLTGNVLQMILHDRNSNQTPSINTNVGGPSTKISNSVESTPQTTITRLDGRLAETLEHSVHDPRDWANPAIQHDRGANNFNVQHRPEELPTPPAGRVVLSPTNPQHNVNPRNKGFNIFQPTYGFAPSEKPFWAVIAQGKYAQFYFIGKGGEYVKELGKYFHLRFFIRPHDDPQQILVWVEHPDIFSNPNTAMKQLDFAFYFLWSWSRGDGNGRLEPSSDHLYSRFAADRETYPNGRRPNCPDPERPYRVEPRRSTLPAVGDERLPRQQRSRRHPRRGNSPAPP